MGQVIPNQPTDQRVRSSCKAMLRSFPYANASLPFRRGFSLRGNRLIYRSISDRNDRPIFHDNLRAFPKTLAILALPRLPISFVRPSHGAAGASETTRFQKYVGTRSPKRSSFSFHAFLSSDLNPSFTLLRVLRVIAIAL